MTVFSSATESTTQPDIGHMAATIDDSICTRMLLLLMEGRFLTAKELAYGAGVELVTANTHLRRLEAGALITSLSSGCCKYFGLHSPMVTETIESLLAVASEKPADPRRLVMPKNLRTAYLCYDHLVEQLGTEVSGKLLSRGWLTQLDKTHGAYDVMPEGKQALAAIDAGVSTPHNGRCRFAYGCTDWSECRPHLADTFGAIIAERCIAPG